MLYLTAAAPAQGDPVALLMVLALAAAVAVMAVRKAIARRRPAETAPAASTAVPVPEPGKAPGSAGKLKLHDVEPKTAAMLMAIVADRLGKPVRGRDHRCRLPHVRPYRP